MVERERGTAVHEKQKDQAEQDRSTLHELLGRQYLEMIRLREAEAAKIRHPEPKAVFQAAHIRKESTQARQVIAAIIRHRDDGREKEMLAELAKEARNAVKAAREKAQRLPPRPERVIGHHDPTRFFDRDNEIRELVERRRAGGREDAIGTEIRKYLSDREYHAKAAWDYAREPGDDKEDYYRMTATVSEKSRQILVEKSEGLPKDVADSLWMGIRKLEEDLDWRIAKEYGRGRDRENQAPQMGDPGYAEYREQQRGKDRGGRER